MPCLTNTASISLSISPHRRGCDIPLQKTVKEVFDRYTNPEEGFTHTSVPIAHMFTGGSPVSRSEARRLGGMLLRFKKATLDFTGVTGIGQAFTHELFVV